MSKPDMPATPDYSGLARQQGSENRSTAITTAKLNNPFLSTPYGQQTVDYSGNKTGDPNVPFVSQSLSPEMQNILNARLGLTQGLGQQAGGALNRLNESWSKPYDFNSIGDLSQGATNAVLSRLEPILNTRQEQLRTQLANQGFTDTGSEGYKNAMDEFGRTRNDAETQAVLAGLNYQPALLGQSMAIRNQPMSEVQGLLGGLNVSTPQFPDFRAGQVQPTDVLGAGQAQSAADIAKYNANMGAYNNQMSGLYGLGGLGLLAAFL